MGAEAAHPGRKIATCCYCGRRTVLVLRGAVQHELACASCGAPLHTMKMLPKARVDRVVERVYVPAKTPKRRKRPKLRKWLGEAFEDLWDEIEDIFD